MKAVTTRQANQSFSALLSRVEGGEEILITKRGRPVAILAPYSAAEPSDARSAAIERAVTLMRKGLPFRGRRFGRDEMHER